MDSEYLDLTNQLINVDTDAGLQAGTQYRIQCTAAGLPITTPDRIVDAYLVLAAEKPTDRAAAAKSAIILQPGREPYLHTPDANRPLWAWSHAADNSISINPA